MAEDWAIDVRKYAPDADDGVIAAIVRHCGIALQSRDASLVAFTDPAELTVVRESWLKKKLGLTDPDSVLDAAIAKVGERMTADHTKNRVTVYYLLAEAFGKLGLLGAKIAEPAVAAVAAVAAAVAAPVAAAVIPAVADDDDDDNGWIATALLTLGGMGVIVIGAAIFGSIIGRPADTGPVPIAPQTLPIASSTPAAPAMAAVAPAIPTGAGVTEQVVDGKPKVSVYFDTAKADVSPDFATVAAPVKAYADSHPGTRIGVSGFNDPRGNATFNHDLAKNRAISVRAALVLLGVPEATVDLIKPSAPTDTTDALAEGRRVDIYVEDAAAPAVAADAPAAAPVVPPAAN
jgi:outer membrane protein OmpA-like peptidoglycan-associated protein